MDQDSDLYGNHDASRSAAAGWYIARVLTGPDTQQSV
jgi:hypothetical protein